MIKRREVDICKVIRDGTTVENALHEARKQAVRHHQMTGVPLVYCRNGKIVYVDPFTGETVDRPKDDPETISAYRPVPYYLHAV